MSASSGPGAAANPAGTSLSANRAYNQSCVSSTWKLSTDTTQSTGAPRARRRTGLVDDDADDDADHDADERAAEGERDVGDSVHRCGVLSHAGLLCLVLTVKLKRVHDMHGRT